MQFLSVLLGAKLLTLAYASSIPRDGSSSGVVALPTTCNLTDRFPLDTASDWAHVKIAGGLTAPRGVVQDTLGNILVVEAGKGVTAFTLGLDGCVALTKTVISNTDLNHGITLTNSGKFLLVSSATTVWRYDWSPLTRKATNGRVAVKNMITSGHSTRTLLIPKGSPDVLLVSHGSDGNIDQGSLNKANGRALVKAFLLSKTPSGGHDYLTAGYTLGYGLRNEVAIIADHNNMIWGVENSGDNFQRTVSGQSTDIHNGNPAEELNYLGDPSKPNNNWYGYPTCFTVWDGSVFPGSSKPDTGSVFIPAPNTTWTDKTCQSKSVAPRLAIEAHSAPIDGSFDSDNSNLHVTLHGSWDSDIPAGYKIIEIPFQKGQKGYEPVASQNSMNGYRKIIWDIQTDCSQGSCLRPSGLTWDRKYTRMFFASNAAAEGELYVLFRVSG